jgi:hypothetical protein
MRREDGAGTHSGECAYGVGWMVSGVRVAGNALWRVRLRGGFEAVFGLHDPG